MANADPAALVAALPNPALVVDDEGTIVVSNALADALAGGPLGGRSVDILLPEPLRGRHVRERRAFAQSEDVREMGRGRDLPFVALDGTEIPTEIGLSRIVTDAGPMTLAIVVDARERLARLAALETRARTDALTGLANRATADDELARRLRARARFCLLAIDLDGLRDANTRFGHAGGDEIIRAFAHRLRSILREEDLVARTGGDEFVVAVGAPLADAIRVGARITGARAAPVEIGGAPVPLTASVGIAERQTGDTQVLLAARADRALFAAKAAGRCAVAVLDEPDGTPRVVAEAPKDGESDEFTPGL